MDDARGMFRFCLTNSLSLLSFLSIRICIHNVDEISKRFARLRRSGPSTRQRRKARNKSWRSENVNWFGESRRDGKLSVFFPLPSALSLSLAAIRKQLLFFNKHKHDYYDISCVTIDATKGQMQSETEWGIALIWIDFIYGSLKMFSCLS